MFTKSSLSVATLTLTKCLFCCAISTFLPWATWFISNFLMWLDCFKLFDWNSYFCVIKGTGSLVLALIL